MKTVIDNLEEMVHEINAMLESLLLNHSSIYQWNQNRPDDSVVIISAKGNFAYRELSEEGRQIQGKLLEEYRHFNSLLKTLLKEQPRNTLRQFSQEETAVLQTIEQQHTWSATTKQALARASQALHNQFDLLKNLYAPDNGEIYLLPDMNALLYFPILEKWEFDGVKFFTLVITPTILSELDSLKINHRNEAVRQKAESLINQVKEFRRRGRLNEGVPLVKGKSAILTIATEPKVQDSLDWLDPSNNDDRFLATIIEVMRLHPRSVVAAISRDINFQNKADFARIPCIEPPEPSGSS
jgi:ATP:corrinoid adenosyltransferase